MWTIGQKVEIVDTFANKTGSHCCNGVISRITMTMVIVKNEHGNTSRFRHDGKQVGYSFPYLTHTIRAATAAAMDDINKTCVEA